MEKVQSCPICSSKELEVLQTYTYQRPVGDLEEIILRQKDFRLWVLFERVLNGSVVEKSFEVSLCDKCGFIFSNPRFSRKEMLKKYKAIEEFGTVKRRIKNMESPYSKKRAARIFDLINPVSREFQHKEKVKILDFGGQTGENLFFFDPARYNCYLIDYEKWDLQENIKYVGKSLDELDDLVDIIICNHTLEHIVDPINFSKELVGHLNEGGLIYFEVPLGAFFREYQGMMKEPMTHVNFFSEESIAKLFNQIGLNLIHLETKYQHLQRVKQWCINAIGIKEDKTDNSKMVIHPRTTKKQLRKRFNYEFIFVTDHLAKRVQRIFGKPKC